MNKLFISNQTHNPICKKSGKKQFCCCDDIMRFFHVIILSRNIGHPEWLLNWKESRKMNNWVTKWCNLKPNGRKHACYVSKEPTLHTPFSKSSLWPPFTFVLRSCPRKWRRRDYKWCFTISAPLPPPLCVQLTLLISFAVSVSTIYFSWSRRPKWNHAEIAGRQHESGKWRVGRNLNVMQAWNHRWRFKQHDKTGFPAAQIQPQYFICWSAMPFFSSRRSSQIQRDEEARRLKFPLAFQSVMWGLYLSASRNRLLINDWTAPVD